MSRAADIDAAMRRHPAGKHRVAPGRTVHPIPRSRTQRPPLRDIVEANFAIIVCIVLGAGFAIAVAAQAFHAWGWAGLTGVAALVSLVILALMDQR